MIAPVGRPGRLFGRLVHAVTGPRGRRVTIAVWVVLGAAGVVLHEPLVQIGAAVALGVLIDTFVVRALLVPSLTHLLGDRAWWPFGVTSSRRR